MIRAGLLCIILTALIGCGKTPVPLYELHHESADPIDTGPDQHDPQATGDVRGRVAWKGSLPDAKTFHYTSLLPGELPFKQSLCNPLIPQIDAQGGMGDVVVYLRGIDPRRARPWDLGPVTVEIEKEKMRITQGGSSSLRFGFVRVGDPIEIISRERTLQIVRGRDAAFFTITLAKPNEPRRQKLSKMGRVELSNASLQYWMRTWLFVSDHPYFVRTQENGDFELLGVPDGNYELVCAVPDWQLERAERDPELLVYARVWYRPMIEKVQAIEVKRGKVVNASFEIRGADFHQP